MSLADAVRVVSLSPELVGDLLGSHYAEVEKVCLEIMSAALTDDLRDLTERWNTVERKLMAHFREEEEQLLPGYQRIDPENAQDLRDQHALLRDHALDLGVAVELHSVRAEQLQAFVDELRAHADLEQATLYRWAQVHLDPATRNELIAGKR